MFVCSCAKEETDKEVIPMNNTMTLFNILLCVFVKCKVREDNRGEM